MHNPVPNLEVRSRFDSQINTFSHKNRCVPWKDTADLFCYKNTQRETQYYYDQHVAAVFYWLPDDHSFSMRSLWNRRWWQGVGISVERAYFLIHSIFFIEGASVVGGSDVLMSSKCGNWTYGEKPGSLWNSYWTCLFYPLSSNILAKETKQTLFPIFWIV